MAASSPWESERVHEDDFLIGRHKGLATRYEFLRDEEHELNTEIVQSVGLMVDDNVHEGIIPGIENNPAKALLIRKEVPIVEGGKPVVVYQVVISKIENTELELSIYIHLEVVVSKRRIRFLSAASPRTGDSVEVEQVRWLRNAAQNTEQAKE